MHERYRPHYQDIDRQGGLLPEQNRSKEILVPHFKVLTISGYSGTGKTVACERLAKRLGMTYVKVGETFRQKIKATRGHDVIGHTQRTTDEDLELDRLTAAVIWDPDGYLESQQIHGSNGVIIEGRLAGFVATDEMLQAEKNDMTETFPKVVRITMKARRKTRYERIHKRESEKDPSLTLQKVANDTRLRDRGNLRAWRRAHRPKLDTINPLAENAVYKGRPLYDIVADTEGKSVEKVVDEIIETLVERGLIETRIELQKLLPPERIVFQNN